MGVVPMILLLERKLLGRFQNRYGPNRVGPYGLLQPLADVREAALARSRSTRRPGVPRLMAIAPAIMIVTALASIAIIPFGDVEEGFGSKFGLYGIDVNIGILYAFAFGSLAFYGLMLGGWASGSKYSFLGAMRSAAQLISYEVSLGLLADRRRDDGRLAVAGRHRQGAGQRLVRAAAVRRLPDLHGRRLRRDEPAARSTCRRPTPSWSRGYNTEFGGMRFGSFFMAEYINMIVIAGHRARRCSSAAGWARARAGSTRSGWS